jgi:hypothetical protein
MLWYHIRYTTTRGIFPAVEPLTDSDPSERKAAKNETPAPEAFAWLINPEDAPKPPRFSFAEWLGLQPEWEGPPDPDPPPNLLDRAYTQYRREMLDDFLGLQRPTPTPTDNPEEDTDA